MDTTADDNSRISYGYELTKKVALLKINDSLYTDNAQMVPPIQKNPHVGSIAVLQTKPGKNDALNILKRVAHNVSYLMKEERFKVRQLVEFYPRNRSLLGMNVNKGMKIMLRLRDPLDEYKFLPIESIMGTMLHELTHNLYGPHDRKFYEKLDQLSGRQWTIEQMGLYDSFLGTGKRLGSKPMGSIIIGKTLERGKGRRLGGTTPGTGPRRNAREMAAIAADKRAADNKTCCNSNDQKNYMPVQEDLVIELLDDDSNEENHNIEVTKLETAGGIEIMDLT